MLSGLAKLAVLLTVAALLYLLSSWPAQELPPGGGGADELRLATLNVFALNPRVRSTANMRADVLVALETTAHNPDRAALADAGCGVALDRHAGLRLGFGATVLVREGLRTQAALVPPPVRGACQPGGAPLRLRVGERWLGVHFAPPACTAVTGSLLGAWTLDAPGSDHDAVVADVRLPGAS